MHSVRIELAKLIFVGTRITYLATGDAGCYARYIITENVLIGPSRGSYEIESTEKARRPSQATEWYQVYIMGQLILFQGKPSVS